MNSKLKDAHMDELFQGILSLSSVEECYNFFERRRWLYGSMQGDGPKGKRGK